MKRLLGCLAALAVLVVACSEPGDGRANGFPDAAAGDGLANDADVSIGTDPCLEVLPAKVDFGGRLVGKQTEIDVELRSCSGGPLTLLSVRLADDTSPDFQLDMSKLLEATPGFGGDQPVTVSAGASALVTVKFTPDQENVRDVDGYVVPDLGQIEILSDAAASPWVVDLRGYGVLTDCPAAVIAVKEGEEVIPQTKLHLIGSQSTTPNGHIAKYKWTVSQPPGSASIFFPSAYAPDPIFSVYAIGTYTFSLEIWDDAGLEACELAAYTVVVTDDTAIRVELTWDTPGDPDETDGGDAAGADLDLHFLHPSAKGLDLDGDGVEDGWFDQPLDCYWFNPSPDWGSDDATVRDDPRLELDDTDGAGPELLRLPIPETDQSYRVGVHEWDAHGFGASFATVRIFIYGELAFEVEGLELGPHAFCDIATIAWPTAMVTSAADASGAFPCTPFIHPLAEPQP